MGAKQVARGGILTGAAIVVLYTGSVIEYLSATACILAGLAPAAALVRKADVKESVMVYAASAILGFLIVPNKRLALEYAGMCGLYPVLKYLIECRVPRKIQLICKLVYCNLTLLAAYALSKWVLGVELRGVWWCIVVWIGANAMFLLYDVWLSRLIAVIGRLVPWD